jgi:transposase
VEEATKVSERTVRRISEQKKHEVEGTSSNTRSKTHKVPKRVTDTDDFDKCVIRRTVHEFYVQEKASPTIPKLLPKLGNRINFKCGTTSLRNIVKELGFRWKKMRNNREVLIKQHDVRCMRVSFLTALNKYREEGRPIVYEDETYIHSSHTGLKGGSHGVVERARTLLYLSESHDLRNRPA